MANPSKRKGTDAEVKLLAWLHANGHAEAVRNPPAGTKDVGDLEVLTECYVKGCCLVDDAPVVIEVKSYKDQTAAINQGLAELDVEMVNAGTSHGVLVVKRRGKGDPGDWLAIRLVRNDPEIGGDRA